MQDRENSAISTPVYSFHVDVVKVSKYAIKIVGRQKRCSLCLRYIENLYKTLIIKLKKIKHLMKKA